MTPSATNSVIPVSAENAAFTGGTAAHEDEVAAASTSSEIVPINTIVKAEHSQEGDQNTVEKIHMKDGERVSKCVASDSDGSITEDDVSNEEVSQRFLRVRQNYDKNLNLMPRVKADLSNVSISKILARFASSCDAESEQYLCLFKGMSYLHVRRLSADQVMACGGTGSVARRRLFDFISRETPLMHGHDYEAFPADYSKVDRVLAVRDAEDQSDRVELLIKWSALPYSAITWEYDDDVDATVALDNFMERQRYSLEEPEPVRPLSSAWCKLETSPKFKGGNELRAWQVEGVNWLQFSWYQRRGCILADEMGLGKTVQIAALLQHMSSTYANSPYLVVAPLSTIGHWKRVLEEWTDLNVVVSVGSKEDRELCRTYEWRYWTADGEEIDELLKFDAIVCSYESLTADSSMYAPIRWRAIIVDEGHRLKNYHSKLFRTMHALMSEHRVLLTGTPVQNEISELWTLLNFVCAEAFPSRSDFLDRFGSLSASADLEALQTRLSPYLLRRLKEDVAAFLPPMNETIVEIELTHIQKQYYRAVLERNREFLNKGCDNVGAPRLVNIGMQLRKCCNHPFLISGARNRITQGLETPKELVDALVCSSGKFVFVDKLLPRLIDGGLKTLIFSQFKLVLNVLSSYLDARGYGFERIDGDVRGADRQHAIDRFSKPDSASNVFLLSTRAGGLGLNLQMASTVIIFDSDWNPQADVQAQARAHRLGQTKDVTVYRLITRRTYEQHMFECASRKLGLDAALLRGKSNCAAPGKGGARAFKHEIENLLRRGVYDVFTDEADAASKQFCDDDIDTILEQRTVRVGVSSDTDVSQENSSGEGSGVIAGARKSSTFSKARFTSSDADAEVDLDAPDFWEKFLPDRHSAHHMLGELDAKPDFVNDVVARNDFLRRLTETYEHASELIVSLVPSQLVPLLDLLTRVAECNTIPQSARLDATRWRAELENPRKKRRRSAVISEQRAQRQLELVQMGIDERREARIAATTAAAAAAAACNGKSHTTCSDDQEEDFEYDNRELDEDGKPIKKERRRRTSKKQVILNAFGSPVAGRVELRSIRDACLTLGSSWKASADVWQWFGSRTRPALRYARSDNELAAFMLAFLDLCIAAAGDEQGPRAVFEDRRNQLAALGSLSGKAIDADVMGLPGLNDSALQQHITCHWKRWSRLFRLAREVTTCLNRYDRAGVELVMPESGRHIAHQAASWWNDEHDRGLLLGVRRYGIVQASLELIFGDTDFVFAKTLADLPVEARSQLPHLRAVELRVRALIIGLGRSDSHPLFDEVKASTGCKESVCDATMAPTAATATTTTSSDNKHCSNKDHHTSQGEACPSSSSQMMADVCMSSTSSKSRELHCGWEWTKRDRVWFQRGLLKFGPGRWELLREKVGLQNKTVQQLKEYYTQFRALAAELVTKGAGSNGRHLAEAEANARIRARHTYCVCESRAGSLSMSMCSTCTMWFHSACVGVADTITSEGWSCPKCRVAAAKSELRSPDKLTSVNSVSGAAVSTSVNAELDMTRPTVAHPMPESWRSLLINLLADMILHDDASACLRQLVDASSHPSNVNVIKRPLHLSAIKDALNIGGYGRPDELAEDVRLVFRNYRQLHAHNVSMMNSIKSLSEYFERCMQTLIAKGVFDVRPEYSSGVAIDSEIELSSKMAVKVMERLVSFEMARRCIHELSHDELVRRLSKASTRWMPKWWRSDYHDVMLVESALQLGFAVEPDNFGVIPTTLNENDDDNVNASQTSSVVVVGDPIAQASFIKAFFNDRGALIRRFRYAVHFALYGIDPNSKASRVRQEQGLPQLPPLVPTTTCAARKRRRKAQ